MAKIHTFDEDSIDDIARAVRRLQAQHRGFQHSLDALAKRRDPQGHNIRSGITGTVTAHPVYPSAGCTFVVKFEDWDFTENPGLCGRSAVYTWPIGHVVAQVYGGTYLAEGTRVLVVRIPSRSKGWQYWILPLPNTLVRFRLTAMLCQDSTAAATQLDCDGNPIGSPITVVDTVGKWQGDVGFEGWAVFTNDCQRYEIVFLEGFARYIQFTLINGLGGCESGASQAKANVLHYWGDAPNGKDPTGGTNKIDVYDRANLYSHALPGARGIAVLDEKHTATGCFGRYVIIACDQMATWCTAELGAKLCVDDTYGNISSFDAATFEPFGQRPPDITGAINLYGLAGQVGDQVALFYSEIFCDWIIVQIQHKEVSLVVGGDLYDPGEGCHQLRLQTRKFAIPFCDTETSNITVANLQSWDLVENVKFEPLDTGSPSSDCKIVQEKRSVCLLQTPSGRPLTETDVVIFQPLDVVTDVYSDETSSDDGCLIKTSEIIYGLCIGDEALDETILCYTDCPTSSS